MLVVAILVVSTGFAFLTSQVQTTQILVRGKLDKNFHPAYDLLVLPKGSETSFERNSGLVDENYLSGLFGGISEHQLKAVERTAGVSLAAPVAMIGYHLLHATVTVPLEPVAADTPNQVFAIRSRWIAQNGLSRYPGTEDLYTFYYYTNDPLVPVRTPAGGTALWPAQAVAGVSSPAPVCQGFVNGSPTHTSAPIACESDEQPDWGATPKLAHFVTHKVTGARAVGPVAQVSFTVPVLIAAITPKAETELVGLDQAMVTGRYLRKDEGTSLVSEYTGLYKARAVPLIASNKTYLDQWIEVTLERLNTPTGTALVNAMTQPAAYKLVTTSEPTETKTVRISASAAYRAVLSTLESPHGGTGTAGQGVGSFFTTSETTYRVRSDDRLAPVSVRRSATSWRTPSGTEDVPPGGNDTAFRRVEVHLETSPEDQVTNGVAARPVLKVVGTFDPTKLEQFSQLSQVPLETFFPPLAYGANKKSRKLLDTHPLGPTTDLAGYLSQPPLLLTTMQAARPFFDRAQYSTGTSTELGFRKPISAIQVRVSGLTGASNQSFARLRNVAVAIEQKTGLTVEVTAGSSPKNVTIDLPKGRYGEPALQVTQGWVKTNTAAVLLRGIDKESLSLWALLLVVSALFVGNAVVADLRRRRSELATLLIVGWTRGELFRLALFEVTAIGLIAGASGTVLAVVLVEGFGLHLALADTLLVIPGGLVLALLAGTGPVWRATRGVGPLELVRPPKAELTVSRSVRGLWTMAMAGVWRRRLRSVLGAIAVAVGVGAATYLVGIEDAFRGQVVGTLLGNSVDLQVRSADLLALSLIGAVAGAVICDLSYLSLKEREPQLAALRATGWQVSAVARLVATEAVAVAVVGGAVGAGIGYAILDLLTAPARAAVPTAVGAFIVGLILALVASVLPVTWWRGVPLARSVVEL